MQLLVCIVCVCVCVCVCVYCARVCVCVCVHVWWWGSRERTCNDRVGKEETTGWLTVLLLISTSFEYRTSSLVIVQYHVGKDINKD